MIRHIVFDILVSLLDVAFLAFLLLIVSFYTGGDPDNRLFSYVPVNSNPVLFVGFFFCLFCIKNLFGFFIIHKQYRFIYETAARISTDNLLKYLKSDISGYNHTDSSVNIRTISQQPVEFGHYVLRSVQQIISQVALISVTVFAIIIFNAAVFLLLLIVLVPAIILVGYLLKRKSSEVRQHTRQNSAKAIQYLQEALSGFIESNIYSRHDFFVNRYSGCQHKVNRYLADQQSIQGMSSRVIEVFAIFGLFILIVIDTHTPTRVFSMVTIGAFMIAAYKIIPGIVKIMNCLGQIKTYEYTVLSLVQDIHDKAAQQNKKKQINKISCIEFNDVSFNYDQGRGLNNFSMSIGEGDLIGISGVSGRGKTTVINLLLGFLKPDSGNVYVNNTAVSKFVSSNYWNQISYIKQQTFFIHDTLVKNITLDNGDYDSLKLQEVIRLTDLGFLISTFPDGLNHIITENGKNLSGGQRQRIMIARALYNDFDLLIMDEPFNELDEYSEYNILDQLQLIAQKGKMIILITHNKKSLSYCNKVFSLDAA